MTAVQASEHEATAHSRSHLYETSEQPTAVTGAGRLLRRSSLPYRVGASLALHRPVCERLSNERPHHSAMMNVVITPASAAPPLVQAARPAYAGKGIA
jgi:hypothetical protein